MKKERAVPVFLRAHEEWDVNVRRAQEISGLIPMSCSEETWNNYVVGVRSVLETLQIPQAESVSDFLERKRCDESFRQNRFRPRDHDFHREPRAE
eukprot:8381757-Pyramimonas_sp.AAC.1